jgi:hypothetical protein
MQRYTTFFIIVNALHVSGGFSANQLAATASGSSSNPDTYQMLCVQFLSS